jgi:hypothetical protein
MSFNAIDRANVPAFVIVEMRVKSISPDVSISAVAYSFDRGEYRFRLTGQNGREADVDLSRGSLDDLRDNPASPNSKYTFELMSALNAKVLETIESSGLISFADEALKFLLLQFVVNENNNGRTVNKYNAIGKGMRGQFEQLLRTDLSTEEKDTLIWAWDELMRLRLIARTGTDLVAPDDWAKATERGRSAVEGKTFTEYAEIAVFIAKGEVYTAHCALRAIFRQARRSIIIIDPYADETVLDHIAKVDASIGVRLLTERIQGDFLTAFSKLMLQRGNLQVRKRSEFHDRFILIDDEACYQIGSSINSLGNKATVVDRKGDEVRDRVLREFAKTWKDAQPIV